MTSPTWPLLLPLLAAGLVFQGCSKPADDAGADGAGSSTADAAFPQGPVELRIKWPVGNRYVHRLDLQQQSDMQFPQRPEPTRQEVAMGMDYAIAVRGEHGALGRQLEMTYLAARMAVTMNAQSLMSYDSAAGAPEDAANPLAAVFGGMIGQPIGIFTNDKQEVERIEGLDELTRRMIIDAPPQNRSMMTNMLGRDILKQMVELHKGMPGRPVQPGDTWTSNSEINMGVMGGMAVTVDYTFLDWQVKEDRVCAHLGFSGIFSSGGQETDGPMGMRMLLEKGTLAGESWVDPELGMTVGGLVNQHMTMKLTAKVPQIGGQGGGSQSIGMELDQRINVRLIEVTPL